MNDPDGRLCDWGFPRTECYGVRLPYDYEGEVPAQMLMADVPEAEYIVFEHGPFDYEQENRSVEERMEQAMAAFDYTGTGYCFDSTPGGSSTFISTRSVTSSMSGLYGSHNYGKAPAALIGWVLY